MSCMLYLKSGGILQGVENNKLHRINVMYVVLECGGILQGVENNKLHGSNVSTSPP